MNLRVENDRRFALGHARITLPGLQMPADGGFRIMREGYAAANLGRRGWLRFFPSYREMAVACIKELP
jgi:hypothetical protein